MQLLEILLETLRTHLLVYLLVIQLEIGNPKGDPTGNPRGNLAIIPDSKSEGSPKGNRARNDQVRRLSGVASGQNQLESLPESLQGNPTCREITIGESCWLSYWKNLLEPYSKSYLQPYWQYPTGNLNPRGNPTGIPTGKPTGNPVAHAPLGGPCWRSQASFPEVFSTGAGHVGTVAWSRLPRSHPWPWC